MLPSEEGLSAPQVAAREQLSIRYLEFFVREAWQIIEPGVDLAENWHIDLICRELQKVHDGETKRLVVCIPPGFMKSLLTSVFLPAWIWLSRPAERMYYTSNDDDLVKRDSKRTRDIVESEWYQRLIRRVAMTMGGEEWALAKDQNEKHYFENTARGFRQCGPIRGKVTGKRADLQIVDDPHDVKEAIGRVSKIKTRMSDVIERFEGVLSTRLSDRKRGRRVLIMQRISYHDLAGHLWRKGGWRFVVLPMEFDPTRDDIHPEDPRTEAGELLHGDLYGEVEVAELKEDLGSNTKYQAQCNQSAPKGGGGLFKDIQFDQFFEVPPARLAHSLDGVEIVLDCAAKTEETSDHTAIHVWGYKGTAKYLLDRDVGKWDIVMLRRRFRRMVKLWPLAVAKRIEDTSNGIALIQLEKGNTPGVIPFKPAKYGDKVARAGVSLVAYEAGEVWLPSPDMCPWVEDFISAHDGFTGEEGGTDDEIDAEAIFMIARAEKKVLDPRARFERQFKRWR